MHAAICVSVSQSDRREQKLNVDTDPLASKKFVEAYYNDPAPPESEDCLYLNVYAPAASPPGNGRAVMMYIFGGAMEFGSGGFPGYDGSSFAAHEDVIIVTINHRTNGARSAPQFFSSSTLMNLSTVHGFPADPSLPLSEQNLAFLDQRAAVSWITRNIHAFGGDPTKVTVFGESSGAFSVDAMLTSYPKDGPKPPFRAAILQSSLIGYRPLAPASDRVTVWNKLATALNCTSNATLSCLRAVPATKLKDTIEQNVLQFKPVPEMVTLMRNSSNRRDTGLTYPFPLLMGTTAQEGRLYARGQNNLTQYVSYTYRKYPGLAAKVLKAYPVGGAGMDTDYDVAAQIMTEDVFQCVRGTFWKHFGARLNFPESGQSRKQECSTRHQNVEVSCKPPIHFSQFYNVFFL